MTHKDSPPDYTPWIKDSNENKCTAARGDEVPEKAVDILNRIVNVKASMLTEFSKRPEVRIACENREEAWKLIYALMDARKLVGTS